ncbi:unnamed protein product [Musa textilis]
MSSFLSPVCVDRLGQHNPVGPPGRRCRRHGLRTSEVMQLDRRPVRRRGGDGGGGGVPTGLRGKQEAAGVPAIRAQLQSCPRQGPHDLRHHRRRQIQSRQVLPCAVGQEARQDPLLLPLPSLLTPPKAFSLPSSCTALVLCMPTTIKSR